MGLQTRQSQQQQYLHTGGAQTRARDESSPASADLAQAPIIRLAARPYFAIVDNEVVTVVGSANIPGMSPVLWCADEDGINAGVSPSDAKLFTRRKQAERALLKQVAGRR